MGRIGAAQPGRKLYYLEARVARASAESAGTYTLRYERAKPAAGGAPDGAW